MDFFWEEAYLGGQNDSQLQVKVQPHYYRGKKRNFVAKRRHIVKQRHTTTHRSENDIVAFLLHYDFPFKGNTIFLHFPIEKCPVNPQ